MSDRKSFRAVNALTLVLAVTLMTSGCDSSASNSSSASQTTNSPNNIAIQPALPSTLDKAVFCDRVSYTYSQYRSQFDTYRYNPSIPEAQLNLLSGTASSDLRILANDVNDKGIDWDSSSVVSGILLSIAQDIDELNQNANNNYFPPGRDISSVQNEMNNYYTSITGNCDNIVSGNY